MTSLVTSAIIGSKILFTSKNTSDVTQRSGVVRGIIDSTLAQSMGDIISYNAAVQKADSTVGDISTLNFFAITDENGQLYAFASEWILGGSFNVVQEGSIIHLDVYDPTSAGAAPILALLKSNGYPTVVVTGINSSV